MLDAKLRLDFVLDKARVTYVYFQRNSLHWVNMFPNSSEYLDEHPCLCTSRFRHILHQLDHDRHKKLADLCSELQKLTMVSKVRARWA